MERVIIQTGLLMIGFLWLVWGGLIISSDICFNWWQNKYWKEANNKHLLLRSIIYNRYGTGAGMFFLGVIVIYSVFF